MICGYNKNKYNFEKINDWDLCLAYEIFEEVVDIDYPEDIEIVEKNAEILNNKKQEQAWYHKGTRLMDNDLNDIYSLNNKNILVTGAGFLASNLSQFC